jgi:hypothetical protein
MSENKQHIVTESYSEDVTTRLVLSPREIQRGHKPRLLLMFENMRYQRIVVEVS